jgi:hypothetical protein
MKHILWRPFDLAKWLVLGFSCWLAGLADSASGGGWKWIVDENDFPGRHNIYGDTGSFEELGGALIWLPLIFISLRGPRSFTSTMSFTIALRSWNRGIDCGTSATPSSCGVSDSSSPAGWWRWCC